MKHLYVIALAILVFSCGKEEKKVLKEKITKDQTSYMSRKWKETQEIFVESDSVLKVREQKYYADLRAKYSEYKSAEKWFLSKPKQLLGEKGEYYKMTKNQVDNNNTITHNNLSEKSAQNTYKYLFVSNDAYYVYDLEIENKKCTYKGVRRIKKGYGSEPVHDLIFDKKGNLSKEVFQGEVKQDLFTKNGHLYFQFKKDNKGQSVENTVDLGIAKNF